MRAGDGERQNGAHRASPQTAAAGGLGGRSLAGGAVAAAAGGAGGARDGLRGSPAFLLSRPWLSSFQNGVSTMTASAVSRRSAGENAGGWRWRSWWWALARTTKTRAHRHRHSLASAHPLAGWCSGRLSTLRCFDGPRRAVDDPYRQTRRGCVFRPPRRRHALRRQRRMVVGEGRARRAADAAARWCKLLERDRPVAAPLLDAAVGPPSNEWQAHRLTLAPAFAAEFVLLIPRWTASTTPSNGYRRTPPPPASGVADRRCSRSRPAATRAAPCCGVGGANMKGSWPSSQEAIR